MMKDCFNITCRGARHEKENTPCQDFSLSMKDGNLFLAVVCDGHGAPMYFRSDSGSRFAAEAVRECVSNYVDEHLLEPLKGKPYTSFGPMRGKNVDTVTDKAYLTICSLVYEIVKVWDAKVREHAEANPMTDEEAKLVPEPLVEAFHSGKNYNFAYGTTLLAYVQLGGCWFAFQIGDGKIIGIDQDTALFPIEEDPQCHDGITTSLCDNDVLDDVRVAYEGDGQAPEAMFLCTDGLENAFASDEKLAGYCRSMFDVLRCGSKKILVDQLSNLLPKFSALTVGDDISLAGVYAK